MMKPEVFDMNAVFEEIVTRGRDNGIFDREAYRDLIEEVLYEHETEGGDLSVDANVQLRIEALKNRFDEYLELAK